jgi:hypothetical protein
MEVQNIIQSECHNIANRILNWWYNAFVGYLWYFKR